MRATREDGSPAERLSGKAETERGFGACGERNFCLLLPDNLEA